jgi:hypothetical protein
MAAIRITKTAAHAGLYARQLAQRLAALSPETFVSYADLSALIGVDVQERRDLLSTARNLVRKEHGIVYDVVQNQGLVRLTNPGIIGHVDGRLGRLQRATHRTKGILDCVQPEGLNALEKHRWLAQQSVVGSVAILTHPKTVTGLAQGDAPPQLPFALATHAEVFKR